MRALNSISMHFSNTQFEILLNLYRYSFLNFDSLNDLNRVITKALVDGLSIARGSIWYFDDDLLRCSALFDSNEQKYLDEEALQASKYPSYFEALQKGVVLQVSDVYSNPFTNELANDYLNKHKIKSLLDIPVRENNKSIGFLCCEDLAVREWSENEVSFARALADIYVLLTEEYKRKLSDKSLIENQERFKFISENISDGIYIIENYKLVFVSKRYLEMIEMTEEEKLSFYSDDMFHLVHPEDVEMVKETIFTAAKNKLPSVKYTHRCRKKNGTYMWREDIMNIHYDTSGNAFRAVIIARDITSEKSAEIELQKKKRIVDIQNNLLLSLYSSSKGKKLDWKIKEVIHLATEGLNSDRVGYWEIVDGKLNCIDIVDRNEKYSDTTSLGVVDFPEYIEAIQNKRSFISTDSLTTKDLEIKKMFYDYLEPYDIKDILDVPLRIDGKIFGILCCSHRDKNRDWTENDISFAKSLADFLSIAIEEDKRLKAEALLVENKKNLDFITNNTTDGILVIEYGRATYVSPTFEKLSGYSRDFVIGISVIKMFRYIHPEDYSKVKEVVKSNLKLKNSKFNYEYRFLGTNGKYYWREDYANVIYNENNYVKIIIISRDIQDRKDTESRLKEKQEQIRLIFENSTDGFLVLEENKIKYISPSYRELLGFSEDEIKDFPAKKIFDLLHPDDAERVRMLVFNNIETQISSFTCEFRIRAKNGKYHWREDLANLLYDADGKNTKYIITSRNIDERKRIEESLVESEKQLKLITENTSDGVVVFENGIMTYVSPSFSKLLGYDKEYYKQMTLQEAFSNVHPDDLERVRETIYGGLAEQKSNIQYEHRFKGTDGNYHFREDSANVLYDENGKYTKYIVITRDITARKEAEKEKNRLYNITEKQNEKLTNFTHIVSHDIRSHTSNLSMILDLYEETDNVEEKQEYFKMLKQSTNKLSETIFFLNETVALQSGLKNEKKELSLKVEIEKALVGINAVVKSSDAKITINVLDNLKVFAIQSYFESIIFNLLTNAIKYKSPLRLPEIYITAQQINDEIKLSFSDNGIGIDLEKNKDKIFGMYKTFHSNSDAVGLGLFMVKNHMESMGGRIDVTSELNIGTTFNLYFI